MSQSADVPPLHATSPGEHSPDSETAETWDEVKSDYQIDPDGQPVPNSMDPTEFVPVEDDEDESDGEQ